MEEESIDEKPSFELYIKASSIDGEGKGSCPICQQYFMISYLLAEEKNADFKVFTVQANAPPKSFTDKSSSKVYPVVIGQSGQNTFGQKISEVVCDSFDDVDQFFYSINSDCPHLKYNNVDNIETLKKFQDLYKDFKAFLQNPNSDGKKVMTHLKNLDEYLGLNGTDFLTGPKLSYADCNLLPKIQHLRIAALHYRGFKIPPDLRNFWNYLQRAYTMTAFSATLPTDQEIIVHYDKVVPQKPSKGRPTLQAQTITTSVPEPVPVTTVNGGGENGTTEEQQVVEN